MTSPRARTRRWAARRLGEIRAVPGVIQAVELRNSLVKRNKYAHEQRLFFSIERSQAEVELVIFPRKQMCEASCSAKARESAPRSFGTF